MFSLRDDFAEKVQLAKYAVMEAGLRHVKAEVLYHMPDQPGLVTTYTHEFPNDSFVISQALLRRIDALLAKQSKTILTAEEAERFSREMDELGDDLARHVLRVERTADQFTIPFRRIAPERQIKAIEDVPLMRLRSFLRHWHDTLDGPMAEVKVAMQKPGRDELQQAFRTASFAARPEGKEGTPRIILPSTAFTLH